MAEDIANLDRIPLPYRDTVLEYANLLREISAADADALVLFGAVAAGSFDPNRSLIRSVLLLKKVDLGVLRRLAEHGAKLGKQRIAAPLIMTPAYIEASLDTFPLELLEIQQKHLTLFGTDHFDGLEFEASHVRLQCERELKVLLISLRQGLLAAAGRDKVLAELETTVGESLIRTLRGLLWLKGQKEAKPALEVIAGMEKLTDRKLSGVRAALDTGAAHGWAQFESLYGEVEALGEMADAL